VLCKVSKQCNLIQLDWTKKRYMLDSRDFKDEKLSVLETLLTGVGG